MRRIILLVALVAAASFAALKEGSEADAGLLDYRLIGGPFGRYYTTNAYVQSSWYTPAMHGAVQSWNGTQTVSFSHTTNWSSSAIDFYSNTYGATGWRGVTVMFASNGALLCPCVGCAPVANWAYAELSLNETYMADDRFITGGAGRTQSTAAHEFGHGIALSHDSRIDQLMYPSITRYDYYGIATPQYWDSVYASLAY